MNSAQTVQEILTHVLAVSQKWADVNNYNLIHYLDQGWYYCTKAADYLAGITLCVTHVSLMGHELPRYVLCELGKRTYLTYLPRLHVLYFDCLRGGYSCSYCRGPMNGIDACPVCAYTAWKMHKDDERATAWLFACCDLPRDLVRHIARIMVVEN